MQIGLVGKPSSGKSSFFSASTLVDVAIASYPFTTIEPNRGIGFVRTECADRFFNVQCNPRQGMCHEHIRYVPVELIDVAGLVPGAHQGKGRGNQFLDDLRKADALIHVVDASGGTNELGEQVPLGSHDPSKDILFLEEEIDWWFFGILKKNWYKIGKAHLETREKRVSEMGQTISGLGVGEAVIENALMKLGLSEKQYRDWKEEEIRDFAVKLRELSKPIVIAANKADLSGAEKNILALKEKFPEKIIVPCSALSELTLKKASKANAIEYRPGSAEFSEKSALEERQKAGLEYIKGHVLGKFHSTGIQECLEQAVFNQLGFISVFPVATNKLSDSEGRILPDCFLVPKKTTALELAFRLHTDIGKNFIKAIDVKTRQLIGKEHELKSGDVIEIVFNK